MPPSHARRSPGEEKSIDPMTLYMSDVAAHPMLTVEEEQHLTRTVAAGVDAARCLEEVFARGVDELTEADLARRDALLTAVRSGVCARERFMKANLRLVVSIAKLYQGPRAPTCSI
ncbi:MAG: hypothetical protein M9927_08830 [Anaerolineae bacterium]|nr:hypothetical protein [Anaerolineae bacterium]